MEIFFRNPIKYIHLAVEAGIRDISFDYGNARERSVDVLAFAKLYLGATKPFRVMTIAVEGASLYDETSKSINKPVAVYPTWRAYNGIEQLESYCAKPVGEDPAMLYDDLIEKRFRPVEGQAHKVVLYDSPDLTTKAGLDLYLRIRQVKAKYPNVELILHDTASYRLMFGGIFDGVIFDPSMTAKMGSVILPNGRAVHHEDLRRFFPWLKVLGYTERMVWTAEGRVQYNIESVRWARENFAKNVRFRTSVMKNLDPDTDAGEYEIDNQTKNFFFNRHSVARQPSLNGPGAVPSDGIICDACTLATVCKLYRTGAVCGMPRRDTSELANMFGSRDASVIIDGLLTLTKVQAERVQRDLQDEDSLDELNPMTDKRIKDLFDAGTKVAKLIDPTLNGKGTTVNVGVQVGSAAGIVAETTPQELISGAVRALEAAGVPRAEITSETITGLLEGMANRRALEDVVDAEVIE